MLYCNILVGRLLQYITPIKKKNARDQKPHPK